MKTSAVVWIVIIILVIVGGGWYWYSMSGAAMTPSTQTNSQTTSTGQTTTPAVVLQSATNATLGPYLTAAGSGMTLYTYASDTAGVSNCTGQCATTWPPYTVDASAGLSATSGVGGALGTVVRADGSTQLTYNGMPLYTYVQDTNPGDVNGQGVANFTVAKP